MAEPDRTNADAERVSDIVKPVAWRWRNSSHGIVSGWFYAEEEPSFAPRDLDRIDGLTPLYTADIIEAQSKALAEARNDVARLVHERDNATKLFVDTAKERNDLYVQLGEAEQQIEALTPTPENPNG